MVAIKSNKFSRLHPSDLLDKSKNVENLRCKKRRKTGVKKIFLKSAARNLIVVPNDNSNRPQATKVVCVKKRCHIQKNRKHKNLSGIAQNSKDRVSSWLKSQTAVNLHQQSASHTSPINSPSSDKEAKPPSKEVCEISAIFQTLLPSKVSDEQAIEKSNHSECDEVEKSGGVSSQAEENMLVSSSVITPSHEEHPPILKEDASKCTFVESSQPITLECNDRVDNDTSENYPTLNHKSSKGKCVSRGPLCSAKGLKSSVLSQRKALQRFYLKNSQGGYQLALKRFKKSKLCKSGNVLPTTVSDAIVTPKVPMEISVKKRLDPPPTMTAPPTPDKDRSVCKFLVSPKRKGLLPRNVVSCKLPDSSVDSGLSEDDTSSPEEQAGNKSEGNQLTEKRDVCYVFALLDRERNETVFKCSPHLKSSEILQQLATVIDTISTDDDLMMPKNICKGLTTQVENPFTSEKKYIDRSTSPILCCDNSVQNHQRRGEEDCQESTNDWEVSPSNVEFSSRNHLVLGSAKLKAVGQEKTDVTAATKVLIVKALMSLTSELKIPTDISVRLLKWSSGTCKGDIDTDACEDAFEGFLCHCHDKVSILLESCSILDSKYIINFDEAELKNMWLLHDALCCMLQAYRYIQDLSSSPSSSFRQHLLSLMKTCAKTILPSDKVSVTKWISLMTMIQGINEKLCQKDVLSEACQCHQHFISLSTSRFCRVCDLNCLYEDLCRETEKHVPPTKKEKSELITSTSSVVEQLFPRYSWFMSRIESLSEEEFKTAYAKHLVVKFACNSQSGLQPCNEHLSEISCTCFSLSPGFDSQAEVDEAASSVNEITNQEENGLPLSQDNGSDHQNQNNSVVETCISSHNTCENNDINSSNGSIGSIIPASRTGSDDEVGKNHLNVASKADSVGCETVSLSGGGSVQSSDDFTLQIEESACEIALDGTALKNQSYTDDESAAETNDRHSGNECIKSGGEEDDSDVTQAYQSSESPDIDYSPLNFQLAQSSLENTYSSYDSHISMEARGNTSVHKHADSNQALCYQSYKSKPKTPVEEIILDSEESEEVSKCMRNVSFEGDSVLGSSPSEDLVNEDSRLGDQGSFNDTTSSETEENVVLRSRPSSMVCEDADESTSLSRQSTSSSDSVHQVLSRNEELDNDSEVSSSNSIDIIKPTIKKDKMDAGFSVEMKQSKLPSPPPSDCSGSFRPRSQSNVKKMRLNNGVPLDVAAVVMTSKEDKEHRTRSSRNLKEKLQFHSTLDRTCPVQVKSSVNSNDSRPTQKVVDIEAKKLREDVPTRKTLDKMEKLASLKTTNNIQTQRSLRSRVPLQHKQANSKIQDVTSVEYVYVQQASEKEVKHSQAKELAAVVSDQAQSSLTNGSVQQHDLNSHDYNLSKRVDNLEVSKRKRDYPSRKKLLSLAKGVDKIEDSEPVQSNRASRSTCRTAASHQQCQSDARDKVKSNANSKQEPFKTFIDSVTSLHNLDKTESGKLSHIKDGKKIVKELDFQSAGEFNEKTSKSANCVEVDSDYEGHTLTSILKMGSTTKNDQECPVKRNISEMELEDSGNYIKKVRFSSPDNSYYLIEDRKELLKYEKPSSPEEVAKKYVDSEKHSSKHKKHEKRSISCEVIQQGNANKSNFLELLSVEKTKSISKKKSCLKAPKLETEYLCPEGIVATRAKNNLMQGLKENESDPQAANSESSVPITLQSTQENKLICDDGSVIELPVKITREKLQQRKGKNKASLPVSDISVPADILEKSGKRKKYKKAGEELSTKPLVNPPINEDVEVLENVQKPQKTRKLKKVRNVKDSETTKEDDEFEPSDYNTSWNTYLSKLREKMLK